MGRLAATSFQLASSDFLPLQRLMYRQTRGKGDGIELAQSASELADDGQE